MSEEHNIDRLFQESFKDFDVDAPKNAWNNIEKRLNKKSRKPLIPLWQKLGGAAAIIGILILIGSQWLINPFDNTQNKVVDAPQDNSSENTPNRQNSSPLQTNPINNEVEQFDLNSPNVTQNISNKTVVASSDDEPIQNSNTKNNLNSLKGDKAKITVASSDKKINRKYSPNNRIEVNETSSLAYLNLNSKSHIIQESKIYISPQAFDNKTIKAASPQKQSLVEVAENIMKNTPKETKKSSESWYVKPQISPVYYGNLGHGSAIDPNLSQNSSQGEVNMSYGINVAYKLNDKIKLRTGVNRVNLNYTTKDVFLIPDNGLASLSNINTNPDFNASVLTTQQINTLNSTGVLGRAPTNTSELNQELGYLEIPIEIEYKLINKKIDVNLIGGASTLLLNDNNLDIRNLNGTTTVGEANNINNLSFSTNLAIGFDYDISQTLILNLEPTFKYQFNTFQDNTTNFRPYFLGVYSGIILKF